MQEFEQELKARFDRILNDYAAGEDTEPRMTDLVRWVKEKLLESYRNGQEAAAQGRTNERTNKYNRPKPAVITTATVRVPRTTYRRRQ